MKMRQLRYKYFVINFTLSIYDYQQFKTIDNFHFFPPLSKSKLFGVCSMMIPVLINTKKIALHPDMLNIFKFFTKKSSLYRLSLSLYLFICDIIIKRLELI